MFNTPGRTPGVVTLNRTGGGASAVIHYCSDRRIRVETITIGVEFYSIEFFVGSEITPRVHMTIDSSTRVPGMPSVRTLLTMG